MRLSRKMRGRRETERETDRQTERERDRDRPGFKGPSVSFGAVGPITFLQLIPLNLLHPIKGLTHLEVS